MFYFFKKFLFTVFFNSSLFLLLIIGIQNSENKSKVKFIRGETVSLPISFIIGMSFISGSISGSVLSISLNRKRD